MIGSGNPQEGELRPQLLDRFGLSVNVATLQDTDTRVELVMSRMQYEEASVPQSRASQCSASWQFVECLRDQ